MNRKLADRYPFLIFMAEEGEGGGSGVEESAETKTFTQEQVNAFLAKELGPLRDQVKALKPAADELASIKESQQTEVEKALARAEAAEKKAAEYESKAARSALVETIATESKLDEKAKGLLAKSGISEESALREFAKDLSSTITSAPQIPTPLYTKTGDPDAKGVSGTEAAARAAATALLKKSRG